MRFSSRLPPDLTPTPVAVAMAGAAIDLTEANPTRAGLTYDGERICASLATPASLVYDPQPLGSEVARAAVAQYLRSLGRDVTTERLALTASTSEAYAVVFKLLCDPGDVVAVPAPSYPLVPHLAALESLQTQAYDLRYDGSSGWGIDFASLEEVLAGGARVIVVVNPNNPTGNGLTPQERRELYALAARYEAALVVDEVFAPYGLDGAVVPAVATGDGPLTFVLDGLSKSAALPQMKLGWIAVHGRDESVRQAVLRLEWVLDAYLPVSAPVQAAAPALLATAGAMQRQIVARLQSNRRTLDLGLRPIAGSRALASAGGWYTVVELPSGTDEEHLVAALATRFGVKVQPGYFYDFAREGYLVLSLLTAPEPFSVGVAALAHGLRSLL